MPSVGETLDDFLLIEELGEGSFAKVFLARQRSMQRTVALKVSEDVGEEGQTLAQLDHPHIVRVYDQRPYPDLGLRLLYMEYMAAGTLDAVIDRVQATSANERHGQLLLDVIDEAPAQREQEAPTDSLLRQQFANATWPDAVAMLGAQLADALDHAHSHGILHRDVKAANVLLAPNGSAKLADFNVSFRSGGEADANTFMGGSPAYMAPEQIEACNPFMDREPNTLDGRIDQFALAVLLWELLSGHLPYENPEPSGDWKVFFQSLLEARRDEVPSPQSVAALPDHTPGMLRQCLARGFSFDEGDRYPSARAFGYDLRVCVHPDARTLMAPAQGWVERWARRHPTAVILLAAIVPNVVLSALNVIYNRGTLVDDATWQTFQQQVAIVNLVAFAIGLTLLVRWARPLIQAVRTQTAAPPDVPPPEAASAIRAGLALGHRMVPVVMALWVFGGLTFPVWWQIKSGAPRADAYFHFGVSNFFFGILATNLSFFLIAWAVQRWLVPRLMGPEVPGRSLRESFQTLDRRAATHFIVSMCVPFVLIMVLAFVPESSKGSFLAAGHHGHRKFRRRPRPSSAPAPRQPGLARRVAHHGA